MTFDCAETSERPNNDDRCPDPHEDIGGRIVIDGRQLHVHEQLELHPYSKSKDRHSGYLYQRRIAYITTGQGCPDPF